MPKYREVAGQEEKWIVCDPRSWCSQVLTHNYTHSFCDTGYHRYSCNKRGCRETMKVHKLSETVSFLTKELTRGIFLKNVHRFRFCPTLLLVLHSAYLFFRANSTCSVHYISSKKSNHSWHGKDDFLRRKFYLPEENIESNLDLL